MADPLDTPPPDAPPPPPPGEDGAATPKKFKPRPPAEPLQNTTVEVQLSAEHGGGTVLLKCREGHTIEKLKQQAVQQVATIRRTREGANPEDFVLSSSVDLTGVLDKEAIIKAVWAQLIQDGKQLHLVRCQGEPIGSQKKCPNCFQYNVTMWCEDCVRYYCQRCEQVGHKEGPMKAHVRRPAQKQREIEKAGKQAGKPKVGFLESMKIRKAEQHKEVERILKTGFLKKQGEHNKGWKNRFFVLLFNGLRYYKKQATTYQKAAGFIPLSLQSLVAVDAGIGYKFSVKSRPDEARTYRLEASSDEERKSWIENIRARIAALGNPDLDNLGGAPATQNISPAGPRGSAMNSAPNSGGMPNSMLPPAAKIEGRGRKTTKTSKEDRIEELDRFRRGFRFFETAPGLIESFEVAFTRFNAMPKNIMTALVQHNCLLFNDMPSARIRMQSVIRRMKAKPVTNVFALREAKVIIDVDEHLPGPEEAKGATRGRAKSGFRQETRQLAPALNLTSGTCHGCNDIFDGVVRQRVHCRHCGEAFCQACMDADSTMPIPKFGLFDPVPLCDPCFEVMFNNDDADARPSLAWGKEARKQSGAEEEKAQPMIGHMFLVKTLEHDVWVQAGEEDTRDRLIAEIEQIVKELTESERLKEESKKGQRLREQWEIDFQDVVMYQKIGTGACGDVFKGKFFGKDVAVKTLKPMEGVDLAASLGQEAAILSQLRHPSLVLYMGACTTPPHMCIVTEWAENGSLYELIHSTRVGTIHFSLQFIAQSALQIAQGVNYLHQLAHPIIHRDLKSGNVLVDRNYNMKIADFGLSYINETAKANRDKEGRRLDMGYYGIMGTPEWMAPEMLLGEKYDEKVDTYSFGVVLCELLYRVIPLHDRYAFEGWRDVLNAVVYQGARPTIPAWVPKGLRSLLRSCLQHDPNERPSMGQLIVLLEKFLASETPVDMFLKMDVKRLRKQLRSTAHVEQQRAASELADLYVPQSNCARCGHHGDKIELAERDQNVFLYRLSNIISSLPPTDEQDDPLPPGWRKGISPQGKSFYYNRDEQLTSWKRPKDKQSKARKKQRAREQALRTETCRAIQAIVCGGKEENLHSRCSALRAGGGVQVLLQLTMKDDENYPSVRPCAQAIIAKLAQDLHRDPAKPPHNITFAPFEPETLPAFHTVLAVELAKMQAQLTSLQDALLRKNALLEALTSYESDLKSTPGLAQQLKKQANAAEEEEDREEANYDFSDDSESSEEENANGDDDSDATLQSGDEEEEGKKAE